MDSSSSLSNSKKPRITLFLISRVHTVFRMMFRLHAQVNIQAHLKLFYDCLQKLDKENLSFNPPEIQLASRKTSG